MELIDTHAHLQYSYSRIGDNNTQPKPGTLEEISGVVQRAQETGVVKILNVGTSLEDSYHVAEISEHFENVFAVLGVHPHNAHDLEAANAKQKFENLVDQTHPVALGEIGLDYYKMQNTKEEQLAIFEWQLSVARTKNLPVCIHTRNAFPDTFELLKKYGVRGLIHSYTGDTEWAKKFIDLGFLIAFNGILTFKNAKALQETAKNIPLNSMVLETDSPFLSPEPERGQINEPAKIRFVAEKIAELKEIAVEKVVNSTTKNITTLFHI